MSGDAARILDVGCGKNKYPGSIGIDFNKNSNADIIYDLNKTPYPFPDNEFDVIRCIDILEHLDDVVKVMDEIWRIGKPAAEVIINVPLFSSFGTYIDPTHKRGFSWRSFDYFIGDNAFFEKYAYSKAVFKLLEREYDHGLDKNRSLIYTMIRKFAMKYPYFYEARLTYFFPFQYVWVKLQIVKH